MAGWLDWIRAGNRLVVRRLSVAELRFFGPSVVKVPHHVKEDALSTSGVMFNWPKASKMMSDCNMVTKVYSKR